MMLNKEYERISDLFEDTVTRGRQLEALASVIQSFTVSTECRPNTLHDATWLLTALLKEQSQKVAQLQDAHIKGPINNYV